MYELNFMKFRHLLLDKPEFDAVGEQEKRKRERTLFFSVVCEKSSLEECEMLSYDDLLNMMSNAESYILGYDEFSLRKKSMIEKASQTTRFARKRLL